MILKALQAAKPHKQQSLRWSNRPLRRRRCLPHFSQIKCCQQFSLPSWDPMGYGIVDRLSETSATPSSVRALQPLRRRRAQHYTGWSSAAFCTISGSLGLIRNHQTSMQYLPPSERPHAAPSEGGCCDIFPHAAPSEGGYCLLRDTK